MAKCYYCGKEGKLKINCYSLKKEQNEADNQKKYDNDSTMDAFSDQEVEVLTHGDEECLHVVDNEAKWVVDTITS